MVDISDAYREKSLLAIYTYQCIVSKVTLKSSTKTGYGSKRTTRTKERKRYFSPDTYNT